MTRDELRAFGLQYSTLEAVKQNRRQLERAGFTAKQIARGVAKLHPVLFENLRLGADGNAEVIDKRLRWVRRLGWTDKPAKCACGTWKVNGSTCRYCRDYNAMRRWSRIWAKKRRRA